MVHFVGAGSGAADLITVRGAKLLGEADVVIYAGSLVNPALLDYTREGCEIHDSAKLTLEEVIALIEKAEAEGKTTVRLHTGDSSIYGAVREQFDELEKRGIAYDVCPGVSAFCGAAAAEELLRCATCDDALRILQEQGLYEAVLHRLAGRIDDMMHYKCSDIETGAILFSKEYGYLCETKDAAALLRRIKED